MKLLAFLCGLLVGSIALGEAVIQPRKDVKLTIGGNIEYEFVDVEGEGGFKSLEGSTLRPDQRSPYVKMDEASIRMTVEFSENTELYLKYKFSDSSANIDINVLKVKFPELDALEVGRDRPIVATKRKTESWPLIATAYWKSKKIT